MPDTRSAIKTIKRQIIRMQKELYQITEKERKAETRRKIEFGGLVIKGGLSEYSKDIILGVILDGVAQIQRDPKQAHLYQLKGEAGFMGFDV